MKLLVPGLVLTCALAAAGPPLYVPDLTRWRLELLDAPGGWVTEPAQSVTCKLVDPNDPNPPKEDGGQVDAYQDAENYRPEPEPTPEQLRQRRLDEAAERKANAWRNRTLRYWFNGEGDSLGISVNVTTTLRLDSRPGENRLELLEPDSGQRAVLSWWAPAQQNRLEVTVAQDFRWGGAPPWSLAVDTRHPPGDLQVLEPDGTLAEAFRTTPSGGRGTWKGYTHPAPPPGTYTVRWAPSSWGDPGTVTVTVVLDRGTDRERRWRFNRLILPGSPPAVLGTFDVDP